MLGKFILQTPHAFILHNQRPTVGFSGERGISISLDNPLRPPDGCYFRSFDVHLDEIDTIDLMPSNLFQIVQLESIQFFGIRRVDDIIRDEAPWTVLIEIHRPRLFMNDIRKHFDI